MIETPRVAVARWEDVPGERLQSYWQRLRESGLELVDFDSPSRTLNDCSGLLLTGGADIDPGLYGEEPSPHTQACNRARDEFELSLLDLALRQDLPVLAVCRGHQLLNVCLGGRLVQHIESGEHVAHAETPHESRFHPVRLTRGTRLAQIYGADSVLVNSRHHQAVTEATLADGVTVSAASADGIVEGIESNGHAWVVGVQWHPERPEAVRPGFDAASRRLFTAFAEAIRRQMGPCPP